MRVVIGAVALLVAGQADAQTSGIGLRPGEITLHIFARGETSSRADRIVIPVSANGRGSTAAAARATAETVVAQITAALIAAGIDRASIVRVGSRANRVSFVDPVTMTSAMTGGNINRVQSQSENIALQVTVADRSGFDRVMQVLDTQNQAQVGLPVSSLRDDTAARRAAVLAATRRARSDADDYATVLGVHVVRVTAVSNAAGLTDGFEALSQSFRDTQDKSQSPDVVVTRATAVVDFVLSPRP